MKSFVGETKHLQKHFVATGFIVNEDRTKMLLEFHKKLGKWAAPGGHIEPMETPEDAVIRETREETGVNAHFVDLSQNDIESSCETEAQIRTPYAVLYELLPETPKEGPEHIHVDFIYLLEANENDAITEQEEEVESTRWFTRSEIAGLDVFGAIKEFALKYLR